MDKSPAIPLKNCFNSGRIAMKNKVRDDFPIALPEECNFESSLKYLILLLNALGLHIQTGKIDLNRFGYGGRIWVIGLFGSVYLFSNIYYYIYHRVDLMSALKKNMRSNATNGGPPKLPTSVVLSVVIDTFNTAGYITSIHSSIFICIWLVQNNWKLMWMNLKEIEFNLKFDYQFYQRIKKKCRFFITLLIGHSIYLTCRNLMKEQLLMSLSPDMNIWIAIAEMIWMDVTHFIVNSIITLFFVLISCSADFLVSLKTRIRNLIEMKESGSLLASELEKWRSHHSIICQFIRWINKCFGPIIVIFIGHSFVSLITNSYQIADSVVLFKGLVLFNCTVGLIQDFVLLFAIIYLASSIKSEVCLPIKFN